MITPVNKSQTSIGIIKSIKKALKEADNDPFLYSIDEIKTLKRKKREWQDLERRANIEERNGFGQYL